MRWIRLVFAVVLTTSVVAFPVAAAMAMTQIGKDEMSMAQSMDDCPCCKTAHKCPSDYCMLKCFNATIVDEALLEHPSPQAYLMVGASRPAAFSPRPDPPPPRS